MNHPINVHFEKRGEEEKTNQKCTVSAAFVYVYNKKILHMLNIASVKWSIMTVKYTKCLNATDLLVKYETLQKHYVLLFFL